MSHQRLVGEEVLAMERDGPRLVGSRCRSCGAVTFPRQASCPRCTGENVDDHRLARTGRLWGFTVQGFPPKDPYLAAAAPFRPFGVGYVDLDAEILVESRLVADDWRQLRIGMPLELVIIPFHDDHSGEQVSTFAFAPTDEAAEDAVA